MCGCRGGFEAPAGFNSFVEEWTAANANWVYDGDENFATFPGYLAAAVAANSTFADFAPLARSFSPYPRALTPPFPLHFNNKVRSLMVSGTNRAIALSFVATDAAFSGDYLNIVWGYSHTDLQYFLEVISQKGAVSGDVVYNTGITLSADREDDIDLIISPVSYSLFLNGALIAFESGFTFPEIGYLNTGVQRWAANSQGMLARTEIFTQAQ